MITERYMEFEGDEEIFIAIVREEDTTFLESYETSNLEKMIEWLNGKELEYA